MCTTQTRRATWKTNPTNRMTRSVTKYPPLVAGNTCLSCEHASFGCCCLWVSNAQDDKRGGWVGVCSYDKFTDRGPTVIHHASLHTPIFPTPVH